jgi:uncharacterized membrane protein YraQ (UPF0718 family)
MQLYIENFWNYMALSAPFFLLGLLLAGLIKSFISMDSIKKSLGGKSPFTFLKAAFIGIPLPLCSCSVIPTAVTLRKAGANNAATSSFLISTPESGVDSISFTYAIMDLPMTIIRPVAAFVSAMTAGVLQLLFNDFEMKETEEKKSCCCGGKKVEKQESRLVKAIKYASNDIIDDIAFWMLIGIALGALIETVVPAEFFLGLNGTVGKLLVLVVGIPLYICASSTTPLAASLIMKGMSPGTALVLLLVGPATNMSNILVVRQYIGTKGIVINLFAIAFVALGFGYLTDFLYSYFSWPLSFNLHNVHEHLTVFHHISGIVLSALLIKGVYKSKIRPMLDSNKEVTCH